MLEIILQGFLYSFVCYFPKTLFNNKSLSDFVI